MQEERRSSLRKEDETGIAASIWRSEVACNSLHFPIAIARRIETAAAVDFPALRGPTFVMAVAALRHLCKRALGRFREFFVLHTGRNQNLGLTLCAWHLNFPAGQPPQACAYRRWSCCITAR